MDLKLADVSRLLNVSENTVMRLVSEGKIPAYTLDNQYRFSPMEIETWMMSRKTGDTPQEKLAQQFQVGVEEEAEEAIPAGSNQFSLYRALNKGTVLSMMGSDSKEEVIREATNQMSTQLRLDPEVTAELLLDREMLMPTALNLGIAVPHSREIHLDGEQDVVNVVFLEEPVAYGALDGEPVHTLFFLFAASDKRHLQLLAKIAHLVQQPETIPLLKGRPNKLKLLQFIRSFEASLK